MSETSQMTSALDREYARALLALATERGAQREIDQQLADLSDVIAHQKELAELLGSRVISRAQRAAMVERIFKGRVNDLLLRFLMVMNKHDRLGIVREVITAYRKMLEEREGKVEVRAFVAAEMEASKASALAGRLGSVLGREVLLTQSVQSELIGGLKIRVGDRQVDGSVATQLRILRDKLQTQGREKARIASRS